MRRECEGGRVEPGGEGKGEGGRAEPGSEESVISVWGGKGEGLFFYMAFLPPLTFRKSVPA